MFAEGRVAHCDPDVAPVNFKIPHGTHCECLALSAAAGCGPDAVPYWYCHDVLQRRWSMICRHGEMEETSGRKKASEKWTDTEAMDPIRAILISNR